MLGDSLQGFHSAPIDHATTLNEYMKIRALDLNGAGAQAREMHRVPASLLVLASVVCVQFGQATGKSLFGSVGPAGVVALRLGLAAMILLVVFRPSLPKGRRELLVTVGFGTAIAGMNLVYPALSFLPLSLATSLQLLGPITLALVTSRRLIDVVLVIVAGAGLWLFHLPAGDAVAWPGVLLALASGAAMASYLLMSRKAGTENTGGGPLARAVTFAALLTVPFGVAESGAALLQPHVLLVGACVAVLGAVLPYSFELSALRRIPPRTVAVLQSLEPAVAGLAGVLVLSENLQPVQWAGLACVGLASAGTVSARSRAPEPP
jgi:threonine/homoserine efflux transporter RhtA